MPLNVIPRISNNNTGNNNNWSSKNVNLSSNPLSSFNIKNQN